MKNKKGITLVALVITIIVLLILVGVAIRLVVGDNGVLNQSTKASKKTNYAKAKEAAEMQVVYLESGENVGKVDLTTTKSKIESIMEDNKDITGVSDIVPATETEEAYLEVNISGGESFRIYGTVAEDGIWDAAFVRDGSVKVLRQSEKKMYHFNSVVGVNGVGFCYDVSVGSKEDYISKITTEFPGMSLDSIDDVVIKDSFDKIYVVQKEDGAEYLCESTGLSGVYVVTKYKKDSNYDITSLQYSECYDFSKFNINN